MIFSWASMFIIPARGDAQPGSTPPAVTLEMKDQNQTIKIKLGDTVRIKLKTLGSAGYQWHFDDSTFKHFELIEHKTEPIFKDERGGAPVWGIWLLKSIKAGNGEIRMDYFRVWEGRAKALDHFTVKVNIEAEGGNP